MKKIILRHKGARLDHNTQKTHTHTQTLINQIPIMMKILLDLHRNTQNLKLLKTVV